MAVVSKQRRLYRVRLHERVTRVFLVDAESPTDARGRVLHGDRYRGTVVKREPDELKKRSAQVEAA